MTNQHRFVLGGKPLPLDLHTIVADNDGRPLSVGDGKLLFDFTFRFVRFAGRYDEEAGSAAMKLVGDVGPMPFSAESPAARAGLATIVTRANEALGGPAFKVTQGRIMLGGELKVVPPVTATSLVATVAAFLIPAIPYLELIALYVRPPAAPAKPGEPALRPEWRRRSNAGAR